MEVYNRKLKPGKDPVDVVRCIFDDEEDLQDRIESAEGILEKLDDVDKDFMGNDLQSVIDCLKYKVIRDQGIEDGKPTMTWFPNLAQDAIACLMQMILVFEERDDEIDILNRAIGILDEVHIAAVHEEYIRIKKEKLEAAKKKRETAQSASTDTEKVDLPEEVKDAVVTAHKQGYTPSQIISMYSLPNIAILWKILSEKKVKYSTHSFSWESRGIDVEMMKAEIVRLYKQDDMTISEILSKFGLVDDDILYTALREAGEPTRMQRKREARKKTAPTAHEL